MSDKEKIKLYEIISMLIAENMALRKVIEEKEINQDAFKIKCPRCEKYGAWIDGITITCEHCGFKINRGGVYER